MILCAGRRRNLCLTDCRILADLCPFARASEGVRLSLEPGFVGVPLKW